MVLMFCGLIVVRYCVFEFTSGFVGVWLLTVLFCSLYFVDVFVLCIGAMVA